MKAMKSVTLLVLICGIFTPKTIAQTGAQSQVDDLIAAAIHGDIITLDRYLTRGTNIDEKNAAGSTALIAAAAAGQTNVVALLLAKGADIEAKDNRGQTALMRAVARGEAEAVALLLKKGADIEAKDNEGNTALSLAVVGQQKAERHVKECFGNAFFQPMAEHELAIASETSRLLQSAAARQR